jgi:cytochrome b6-f complex iron-sulfur subunit
MTTTQSEEPTRRTFCVQATTLALFASALAPLLEGCGGGPTSPSDVASLAVVNGTRGSGGITLPIDSNSPLFNAGSAALVQTSDGNFLVAHTAQNTFSALSATCTHQVCTIDGWSNQSFVCPCHGSTFDTSGRVVAGPAPTALHQYPTQFVNGVLTITA